MAEITKPVTLTLSPEHFNTVLHALEQLPYKVAVPVMADIHTQVLAQLDMVGRGNDRPDHNPN